ncbi:toxin Cry1Ac domain D-VI-related protein [Listeria booriae]|uniref:Pesticidal crystal protein Cry1Aa domain-containing protein n=1 Tax=Listeria booriae TaxID=1552123 RepID=A0A841XYA4_9LIST|nr:toxin Cry1Ac domain D-VI-related protein [Listeria booriae]MBC1317816.1 hypothetical protein [Listeria booriae]
MLNKKMQKTASVLSIAALLGTTIVTPLGVLSTNAASAQAATATAPSADATTATPALSGDFNVSPFATSWANTYRFNNYSFGLTPFGMGPGNQKTFSTYNVLTKVADTTDTYYVNSGKKKVTILDNGNGIRIDNMDGDSQLQFSIGVVGPLVVGKEYTFSYRAKFNKPGKHGYNGAYISPANVFGSQDGAAVNPSGAPTMVDSGYSKPEFGTFIAPPGANNYALTSLNISTPTGYIIEVSDLNISVSPSQEQKDLQAQAQTAVNNLFAGSNPANDIKYGLTQTEINSAKDLVSQLDDSAIKNTLTNYVNKAQTQLDQQNDLAAYNTARAAVNDLFANQNTNGSIKTGLTQTDIDAAKALAGKVVDPTKLAELQADLTKAQNQLNAINEAAAAELAAQNRAREAVNNLFTNQNPAGNITGTMTQGDIYIAQALINNVTDINKKAELQADLSKAQTQLNAKNAAETAAQNQAREAVNNLFINKNPAGNITGTMTQGDIDAAQALIDKVTDSAKKADLQKDLNAAQAQLNAKNEAAASDSVKALFNNDDTTGTIKDATDQKAIDAAQKTIDAVTNPAKKEELKKDLDEAQAQLDARNAAEAADKGQQAIATFLVKQLYQNDNPDTDAIKDITNQVAIDAAQAQIDLLLPSAVKTDLQNKLDRAKELLDARNQAAAEQARQEAAEASIKDLFNNNDTTGTIKDATDQTAIDAAQKTIDAVTDPTKKEELQKDLDAAQTQLDAKNAAAEAEKANQATAETSVKDLFNNNDTTGTIKDTTDQTAIDAAQKTIDAVTDPTKKEELQKDLDAAQTQLDAKNAAAEADKTQQTIAKFVVNQLFQDSNPSTDAIKDTTTQSAIYAAQEQVDLLLPSAVKTDLQNKIDRAQELLDARDQAKTEQEKQAAATASVKDLFTNGDVNGTIKATTDQKAINAAKEKIDAVTDPTVKEALQSDLDKAQTQLDAKNAAELAAQNKAREGVNNLFTNQDPTGNITETLTQGDIDAAQALVDKVTDPAKKAELQSDLNKAQQQLTAKEVAADAAVKELFNNGDVTGTIKDTTDQNAIDNAQKAIDAVTNPTKKAELQNQLNKAQELLNSKNAVLDAPTIDKYTYLDSFVTGKVSDGTATVSLYVNGVRVKRATPDASGNYKFDAYGLGLNAGVTFEVRPVDANGKEGTPATAKVEGKDALSNALTANDAGISTTAITGTVGNGIDNVRLSIDGVIVKVGQISNGTYSIATNGLIKADSVVQVVGYSSAKVELARAIVKIVNDEKPTLSPLTTDDDVITGYVTAGSATSFRVSINGVAVKTGTIAADGTFQSSIGKQPVGTEVKIEIRDVTGYNALRVSTVIVTGSAVAKLDAPTLISMDGNYIIGTAVKGTETVVIYEDGVAKRTISAAQMTTNPDGSLSFRGYVAPGTKNVQAVAKNSDSRMTSNLSTGFAL